MTVMSVPSKKSEKKIPIIERLKILPKERLIFALDYPSYDEALAMVDELGDLVVFYKLGLELFMAGNYFKLVSDLVERDKKVFVDLKFFDVPKTMGFAIKQLRNKGATFASVHHGNDEMLKEVVKEKGDLKILSVTLLTCLDQNDIDDLGFRVTTEEVVLSRAKRALDLGCDGVISSGLEAPKLREEFGNKFLIITPGIRPAENIEVDDQKRTVDVEEAFEKGADYIVVGRPIKDAPDPRKAAEDIQIRIKKFFEAASL